MTARTKEVIGHALVLIGLTILGFGIYELGYHNGMERIRTGESGLGGLAEWAGAWIEIAFGTILTITGTLIKLKAHNSR